MLSLRGTGSNRFTDDLWSLAQGPHLDVSTYSGYKINGFRFHTRKVEERRKTQNSGVLVNNEGLAEGIDFYGVLTDVIELLYLGRRRIAMFKCEWRDVLTEGQGYKRDKYGFISVNTKRSVYGNDPFVLASQAHQIFFVSEIRDPSWHVVVKTVARTIYDVPERVPDEEYAYQEENPIGFVAPTTNDEDDEVVWCRDDIHGDEVDASVVEAIHNSHVVDDDSDEEVVGDEEVMLGSEDEEDEMMVSDEEDEMDVPEVDDDELDD
jgi:hypothetical protein